MGYLLSQYQRDAWHTADKAVTLPHNTEKYLLLWALALCGEAGEFGNKVKKIAGHGHEIDRDALIDELGDILWYVSALTTLLETDLSTVALRNVNKLTQRYPEGFSEERSINREV